MSVEENLGLHGIQYGTAGSIHLANTRRFHSVTLNP